MATKIGGKQIMNLKSQYSGLAKRAEGFKKKGEETVGHLVSAAEVSAAAFAFGAVQGKYGAVEVLGVPADLGGAVLLHLAGFMGIAGKASDHLHSFADGALASFFFTMGRGTGVNWKQKSLGDGKKKEAVSGDAQLSEGELAALSKS